MRADEFLEEGPFLITGTDFLRGSIDWSDCYHVSEERYREAFYIHVKNNDLLITKDGTIGKVVLVNDCPQKAVLNSGIFLIRSKDDSYDHQFAYYVLTSEIFDNFLRLNLNGSTINHLYQNVFEKFEIPIPNHTVQIKIASILRTIDQAIEKTEALIEKYQDIKAGLMHDLFTRGIGADGKLRPQREQAPELYQETPIGWIPKDWEWLPLRTKSKPGVHHLRTGPFGSTLKGEHWVEYGNPVITIGSLGEGEFNASELLFINDLDAKRLFDFQMKLGEVVFSRVADVGRSVVIKQDQVGWIMSSNLMRISLDQNLVNSDYLQYQLSYDTRIKKQIRCKVNSGGRELANSEILNSLLFIWPTIDEQNEIVNRAKVISRRINSDRQELQKLMYQKSGLMHDLLSGKVPVTVDKNSAEAANS